MAKDSMIGYNAKKDINRLARRIMSNASFLDKEDVEVLEFLANKGDFNNKTAVLKGVAELMESEAKQLLNIDSVPFVDEVEEFNEKMGKGWQNRKTPTIDLKDAQFVINFIQEELDELKMSVAQGNIVEVLDALLDITYVGLGNGALVFGLKDKIIPGYAEVQASNMSKICKNLEEAAETVKIREKQQGETCHWEQIGDNFVVYRTRDHKVMKSINYFPPNLKQFFTYEEISEGIE